MGYAKVGFELKNECAAMFCKRRTKPNQMFCQKCFDKKSRNTIDDEVTWVHAPDEVDFNKLNDLQVAFMGDY